MNNWTIEQNDALLNAIELGVNPEHVIEIAVRTTKRSEKSIRRRLHKIGYLRNSGRNFSGKMGFAKR